MPQSILDYTRIALYVALVAVGFFLFQAWNKDHPPIAPTALTATEAAAVPSSDVPTFATPTTTTAAPAPLAKATSAVTAGQLVTVKTDVLDVAIDTKGGKVTQANLLNYPESLHSKTPFLLLNNDDKSRYLAESGLLSNNVSDTDAIYSTPQTTYTLSPDAKQLIVNLNWQKNGITITKTFTFTRGSYEIKVGYDIANHSAQPWQGSLYTQLLRTNTPPPAQSGMINLPTYFGAAISSPAKPYTKITFKQMQENDLSQTIQNGWAAMIQHYFISAWVPPLGTTSQYYSRVNADGLYTIGFVNQPMTVAPNATLNTQAKLYVGPAIADQLEKTAPGLKLTIDYGWLWFISSIIFWMMQKIFNVVHNWGWSIVIVTVIIKLLFYQLSAKSYRSMSMLKKLQPRIEALKKQYGDDKQALTQATIALYRQEKVNPMGGCLPILIQIPVFIALYWVLVESVELRQAPFIFWIHDLSQHDPYYILPIMMGLSMFIQQRLNPPPPDPTQAKVMMLMPVIFTVLFMHFPAGLMLYWFVNNTLSFLQQWYVMHRVNAART